MSIRDLVHLARLGKRRYARKASAQKWAAGIGIATTAAAVGVVTGILIAPKSGEETRAELKKKAAKSASAVKDAIADKAEAVKDFATEKAHEATNTLRIAHPKAESSKKNA
jgi:gas vesicle protein